MEKNSKSTGLKNPNLSVIKKNEKADSNAKIINLKKPDKKSKILLPPPQEKYIKTKKHDFR